MTLLGLRIPHIPQVLVNLGPMLIMTFAGLASSKCVFILTFMIMRPGPRVARNFSEQQLILEALSVERCAILVHSWASPSRAVWHFPAYYLRLEMNMLHVSHHTML